MLGPNISSHDRELPAVRNWQWHWVTVTTRVLIIILQRQSRALLLRQMNFLLTWSNSTSRMFCLSSSTARKVNDRGTVAGGLFSEANSFVANTEISNQRVSSIAADHPRIISFWTIVDNIRPFRHLWRLDIESHKRSHNLSPSNFSTLICFP